MRFLVRFQLLLLGAAAAGLGLLFGLTGYADLLARGARTGFGIFGNASGVVVALTPARYQLLRWGLACVAVATAVLRAGWPRQVSSPPQTSRSGGLAWRVARALARPWQQLRPAQRWLVGGLLVVAAVIRGYYAIYYPLSLDEIASYDYWVLPGAALTASYYPFPNNHVLPNLLAGLVHTLAPAAPPQLALRLLPTLLSLLTLPVAYALALRYLRFGVATLGLGLYWLSPLAAYYAVAGRGYAWTLVAALAGLFATLELLRPGARRPVRQLAWVVFGLSGTLGLYAVPTHLYALLGLGLGLLVGFGRGPVRGRTVRLAHLAVATLGIALVAVVLYAPIGAVSGWPALLANPYVVRQAWPEFRLAVVPFLVGTATELLGQRGLSALVYALLLLLAPVVLWRGQLPAPTRRLGWLLYAQLGLWLPLSVMQHVLPPARTLLLVLLAFFLLAALLGQVAWAHWQGVVVKRPGLRLVTSTGTLGLRIGALVLVLAAYGGYRLHREQAVISAHTRQQAALRQSYDWLRTHPFRRVWVEPRAYALFWQHYALSAGQPPLPLRVVYDVPAARPGSSGEVEALPANSEPALPASYRNELLRIVPVSPTQPLIQW